MTWEKAVNDLIERYLFAVGEELPRRLAPDVTRELRTLIEDKLEDRMQALGTPVDLPLTLYVLQEIGEPGEVARRYHPTPQYLVGPRFYPAFIKLLKIGLIGLAIMVLFTTILGQVHSPADSRSLLGLATLLHVVGMYYQIAIALFAQAVIVLAVIERTSLGQAVPSARQWDPRDLPEVPESEADRVSRMGMIVDISLIALVTVVLNFLPQWLGVVMVAHGQTSFVPLADFGIRLPLLAVNIYLAAAIGLKLIVMTQRRWTAITRWARVGVGLLGAAVLFLIAATSSLHAPTSAPEITPALLPLGWALNLVPFAVLLGPLSRLVEIIKGRPRPAIA